MALKVVYNLVHCLCMDLYFVYGLIYRIWTYKLSMDL